MYGLGLRTFHRARLKVNAQMAPTHSSRSVDGGTSCLKRPVRDVAKESINLVNCHHPHPL